MKKEKLENMIQPEKESDIITKSEINKIIH